MWHNMIQYEMIQLDIIQYDTTQNKIIWYSTIWYDRRKDNQMDDKVKWKKKLIQYDAETKKKRLFNFLKSNDEKQ